MIPAASVLFQVTGTRMLERIVPDGVVTVEVLGSGYDDGEIFPAELAAVAAAVPGWRRRPRTPRAGPCRLR